MDTWYSMLNRPPLTPPSWVFSPVWTALYIMIVVSIVLYYRSPEKEHVFWITVLLVLHLVSNVLWTYFFFGLRSPALALIDILVLDISLVVLVLQFWSVSVWSGALLIPYLVWVLFATYLNYGFYRLN